MATDIDFEIRAKDAASKQFNKVSKSMERTEKKTGVVNKAFGSLWVQMALGTAAFGAVTQGLRRIIGFFSDLIKLSGEQERVERQLNAVLESTGYAAGLTAYELKEMAKELQDVTAFGDETTIAAQNILLTFTKIGREVFPAATETVLNMSQALGQDLKSSAIQLGKALNDPVKGVTALQRVGVSFTKSQKDVIKDLAETGRVAEAQKLILAELNIEFGGSARAYAETFPGALQQARNAFGDFQEVLGDAIIENLDLRKTVDDFKKTITDPAFIKGAVGAIEAIITVFKVLSSFIGKTIEVLEGLHQAFIKDNPVIKAILQGWINLILTLDDELSQVYDRMDEADRRAHALAMKQIEKFREFRLAVRITGKEMEVLRKDFVHIDDAAAKFNAMMRAIRAGKYDKLFGRDLSTPAKMYLDVVKHLKDEHWKKKGAMEAVKKEGEKVKKVTDDQRKAIEKLSGKIGILTKDKYTDLNDQVFAINKIWNTSKGIIQGNVDKGNDLSDVIDDLIAEYKDLNLEPPKSLQNLKKETDNLRIATVPMARAVEDYGMDLLPDVIKYQGEHRDAIFETEKPVEDLKIGFEDIYKALETAIPIAGDFVAALEGIGLIAGTVVEGLFDVVDSLGTIQAGIKSFKDAGDELSGFAKIVGQVTSSFTLLSGAIGIAKGILKALSGPSGELEAARRRMEGLQMNTAGWGAKIEELAKQLGGADSAGRAFNALLADMIRDSDINRQNFDTYIAKVREIVSAYEDGSATIEETQRNYGSAFNAILEVAKDLGLEGGRSMTDLVKLADEFGLEVEEIDQYIRQNMIAAVDGWRKAMENFGGYSIPVLDNMIRLQDMIADNQPLIDSIQGAEQALRGMANAGEFAREGFDEFGRSAEMDFREFEAIALDAMGKLKDAGFTTADALKADTGLAGILQQLIFLSEEYGLAIDADVQKMIDMGVESGAISEDMRTDNEKIVDAVGRVVDKLDEMIFALTGKLPGAIDTMVDGFERGADRMQRDIEVLNSGIEDISDNIQGMGEIPGIGKGGPGVAGFQHGTSPGGFVIPPGFPNDSFLAGFSSGERIQVTPAGSSVTNNRNDFSISAEIIAAPGGDSPGALMDKFIYGIEENLNGARTRLKRALNG